MAKAGEKPEDDDASAADDDEAGLMNEATKTLLHTYPLKNVSTKSQCGVCAYLNPPIDGVILRRQSVRLLDKNGEATGKWQRGEVRITAVTPKGCAPDKNESCPARETRLVVGANVDALVSRMLKAERSGNFAGVSEVAARVSELDEALQVQFATRLAAARVQQAPTEVTQTTKADAGA